MKTIIETTVTVQSASGEHIETPVIVSFPDTISEAHALGYEEMGIMALAAAAASQRYARLLTGKRAKLMTPEELSARLDEVGVQIRRGFTRRPPKPRDPFERVLADMDTKKMSDDAVTALARHAVLELQRRGVPLEQIKDGGKKV